MWTWLCEMLNIFCSPCYLQTSFLAAFEADEKFPFVPRTLQVHSPTALQDKALTELEDITEGTPKCAVWIEEIEKQRYLIFPIFISRA